jgi:hypothetical protein
MRVRAMRVLVLCDTSGKIESIAVLDPNFPGELHLEVEGGPVARELEVNEAEIPREDLLGQNGADVEERALQKLDELI